MVRNSGFRETGLRHAVEEQLRAIVPSTWVLEAEHDRGGSRADLLLSLRTPEGDRGQVLVEVKRTPDAQDVPAAVRQLARYRGTFGIEENAALLVAASYVSPRARELLAEAGVGWYDTTGNLRLHLHHPAMFVDRVGAHRRSRGAAGDRRLQSLRGRAAARVVHALLDGTGTHRVRELAQLADVAATSARVLDLLSREALVQRAEDGMVTAVRKKSLVHRWVQDYGLTTSNGRVLALAPRGVDRVLTELARYRRPYAVTGSAALRAHLPPDQAAVTGTALLTLFVDDPVVVQVDLGVRETDRGANVMLLEPFDAVVYRNPVVVGGIRHVSPGQVVADLLTGPGRAPQDAAQLLAALATSDTEWAT